jgi:nucleotide-binding universal stress UspA family protein
MAASVVPIVPAIHLKRILYATDFSKGSRIVLGIVTSLAHHYHSEVLAAHISPALASAMQVDREGQTAKNLANLLRVGDQLNISIKPIVKTGDPVQELNRIVQDEGVDLAVVSTHGRIGLKHLTMGSVAEALVRNLLCPVLTVGPHLAHRFLGKVDVHNILFPTDLSEESKAVFPHLVSVAHEYGARIAILHVLPPETAGNPDSKALAEPLRKEMMHVFSSQISPKCEAEFLIKAGDTAEQILDCARDREVDLIGLGIRKAGELATHFRNTVTYRILLQAECPVLTHRSQHPWALQ